MELQIIMDGGTETLNEAMWFADTPSPPYEQLSPNRPNRCDGIAAQRVSRKERSRTPVPLTITQLHLFPIQVAADYNDSRDTLWQDKQNVLKSCSEEGTARIRSSNESPCHVSSSPEQQTSSPSQPNNLKRRSAAGEPTIQPVSELDRKHARRDGQYAREGVLSLPSRMKSPVAC